MREWLRKGPPVTHRTSSFVFTLAAFATPEGEAYAVGSPRLLLVTRRA
jgi:hypothetical protein